MTSKSWLFDIVVVNESDDEATAGDVSVFRSAGEACRYLESWWVTENLGVAFTAAGERLSLGIQGEAVVVLERNETPGGEAIVQKWLRHSAAAVLGARKTKAAKFKAALGKCEEQGMLPDSIEGLIAYIGFTA